MRRAAYLLVGMMVLLMFQVPGWASGEGTSLALIHGLLIDGSGGEPVEEAVVVIRNGLIVASGPSDEVEIPADVEVIDVKGAAVLPGFINAHVHEGYNEANLRAWAQAGVTAVRDLGTLFAWTSARDYVFAERDRLNGDNLNARLVAAGPIITAVGGYGGYSVSSPKDAREKVNGLIDAGADVIKIAIEDNLQGRRWPMLSPEEIDAIVETAHARGVLVAAHVSRSDHVQMAIDAGLDDVNHMAVDSVSKDRLSRMVEHGMGWVPTLELWSGVSRRYGLSWHTTAARNLRRFVEVGGTVALGTDYAGFTTSFDLGMPITEITLMHDAGMTAMQIIEAATRNAATVCGLAEELGTIDPGKIADVIVVDGNPLGDVRSLESVIVVIHNGVIIRDER